MDNIPKSFIEETDGFIRSLGYKDWIDVYQRIKTDNGRSIVVAGLIPEFRVEEILKDADWAFDPARQRPGCSQYNDGSVVYRRFGSEEGYEPLIIERSFDRLKPDYLEILEEFRLFHNLHFDAKTNKYVKIMDDGQEVDVARVSEDLISIRAIEVKQFLAIKEMRLALFFDIDRRYPQKLSEIDSTEENRSVAREEFRYQCVVADSPSGDGSFVRIHGNKLIQGFEKKDSGFWPFNECDDEEKEYTKFIVGVDDKGKELLASSDPHGGRYLTPVYFRPEVLNRYYENPSKYSVEDGYLRCGGLWGISLDNDNSGYVTVFLGDLGRDLPDNERLYWRSFNIVPAGPMSATAVRRSFLAEFANPERPDLVFKDALAQFEKIWTKKYGWPLFRPLPENDRYCLTSLRIPATPEQNEFDAQVMCLTKVLVDSLNDAELAKSIAAKPGQKSISKLEEYLRKTGMSDVDVHIEFLRDLQSLRSTGAAHKKGSEYEKASKKLGLHEKDPRTVFAEILDRAIKMLGALKTV
ncbi:MAG: hypothetical protein ACYDCM_05430 [Candidatus Acidiferrales bacterium]